MDESASRRQFLRNMTALGAAGGVSVALGADGTGAKQSLAQAQPTAHATLAADSARGLARIQLMIGPGTLPSVGKDRMDLLRYRLSGNPRLTGEQMLELLPEIARMGFSACAGDSSNDTAGMKSRICTNSRMALPVICKPTTTSRRLTRLRS
jgi:hypothetical protein